MKLKLAVLAIAAMAIMPLTANAQYEAKAGNRALELEGTDAVTNQWVDMSDYHGKWVLAEFWATW